MKEISVCNSLQIKSVLNIRIINSTNEVNKTLADFLTASSKIQNINQQLCSVCNYFWTA